MKSKNSCRVLVAVLSVLMIVATLSPIASVKAASDFHLIIGFGSDYNSSQGHVEYKLDDGSWVSVTEEADIQITDDVTSITFKVVPAEYHEVNFDNGPELDGPVHVSFHAGDAEEVGLTFGSGRSPGVGHGNPLQYSYMENPMDREAWWAAVHRVAKSRT